MNGGTILAIAACASGCSDGDACIAQAPSIAMGVYGYVTFASDVKTDSGPSPASGIEIGVRGDVGGGAFSDRSGFYEIALPPGNYTMFETSFMDRAVVVDLTSVPLQRYDLGTNSFAGDWASEPADRCRP